MPRGETITQTKDISSPQINVIDVRCHVYKVSRRKRHLIWAELPEIISYLFIVYLFYLKMYTGNRYILSVSLLPELIESHIQNLIDKWVNFGNYTAESYSFFPFFFPEGCLWRKLDLLFTYSNIVSQWLYVLVQLTLLTIWVK